jgi:chemotaxis signal transduction protein
MSRGAATRPAPTEGSTIVCCAVGPNHYAFDGADVRFIVRSEQLRPAPPDAPAGCVGILRADVDIPVYLLARHVAGAAASGAHSHIVVTQGAGRPIGWLVSNTIRNTRDSESSVLPLPPIAGPLAASWFKGLIKLADRPYLLLSPRGLDPSASSHPPAAYAPVIPPPPHDAAAGQAVVLFATVALPPSRVARYAVSARQVLAVVAQTLPATPLPSGKPQVNAVALWRDIAVPVVDFRGRVPDGRDTKARYLIAHCGALLKYAPLALPIEQGVALHKAGPADRQLPRDAGDPPYLAGVFEIGGELVGLVDIDKLASA